MGAEGNVTVYDYQKVSDAYRKSYSKKLENDWWYLSRGNCLITIGKKQYIVGYRDNLYETHNYRDSFWFGNGTKCEDSEACQRVCKILDQIGSLDKTEVWT